MGMSSYWIDAMEKEQARLVEELYQLHQAEIARSRNKVERLKAVIKRSLSRFDYDSLE